MPPEDAEDATILIVDDEEKLADMYTLWLRNDYEVRTVYAGADITSELDRDVDVVLLDRRMPGHSGEDVLQAIRRGDRDVSVVLVTAVTPDFDVLELPFDDYLGKPVQHDDLETAIELQLRARRHGKDLREYLRIRATEAILALEKSARELDEHPMVQDLRTKRDALADELRHSIEDVETIRDTFDEIDRGPGLTTGR